MDFEMGDYADTELIDIEMELETISVEIQCLLDRQTALQARKAVLARRDKEELEQSRVLAQQTPPAGAEGNWESGRFDWSERAQSLLLSSFGLRSFRPLQLSCINAALAANDVVLIMPTGGGKSLCYQLPAVMSRGFSLVVTPLVSLMEDQVMAADRFGITARMMSASSSKEEVRTVHAMMVDPGTPLKLLYVSPEKLSKNKTVMNRLEKAHAGGLLSRIVIDEVHCASQWGHDFRPDYKILGILKRQFKGVPILGLTATATSRVLQDVKDILNIPRCLVFKSHYNRANLHYEVRKKPANYKTQVEEMGRIIKREFPKQSGIIYTLSKKDADQVSDDLKLQGIKAGTYHSDVSSQMRRVIHRRWLSGEIQVVVATIAFGMGIDKPNVRFVIHHTMSKSVENYYQESGRAGRDGSRAHCIVFYRPFDTFRQSTMVFQERTGLTNLYTMIRYCLGSGQCRRACLAEHFGDRWKQADCDRMCDVCCLVATTALTPHNLLSSSTADQTDGPAAAALNAKRLLIIDITDLLKSLLNALNHSSKKKLTSTQLVAEWGKSGDGKMFKHFSSDTVEVAIVQAVLEEVLSEDFHFTPYNTISYLTRGPKAGALCSGFLKVTMPNPEALELKRKQTSKPSVPRTSDWMSAKGTDAAKTITPPPLAFTTAQPAPSLTTSKSLHSTGSLTPSATPTLQRSASLQHSAPPGVHSSGSSLPAAQKSDVRKRASQQFDSHVDLAFVGNNYDDDYDDDDFDMFLASMRGKRKKELPQAAGKIPCAGLESKGRVDNSDELVILSDSD